MQPRTRRSTAPRRAGTAAPALLPLPLLVLAALLLAAAPRARALYSEEDGVVIISNGPESLKEAFFTSHGPGVLEFYSPSCPHCVALAPEIRKVAANLKGIATVAAVDCSTAANRMMCGTYGVRAFPTLKLFGPDLKPNPYTGDKMKDIEDFKGEPNARSIAAAVTDLLHDRHISSIATPADLDAFAPALAAEKTAGETADGLARVLLFTDKPRTTVLYKGLSVAYAGRLRFGQAAKGEGGGGGGAVAAQLGVEEYPTLIVVKPDGSRDTYSGALKAAPLRAYLDAFAAAAPIDGAAAPPGVPGGEGGKGGPEAAINTLFDVPVERLAASNLTDLDAAEGVWLLGIHAGGDRADACKEPVAAFDAAARAMQAVVRYATLDAGGASPGDRKLLGAMGVDLGALAAEPCALQVVLLPFDAGKAVLDEYKRWEGGLSDTKALQAWVLEEVPDSTAILTTDDALTMFMQSAPKADGQLYGKVVLFASKGEVPGVYKALAANAAAKGLRYAFGWVPAGAATQAFAERAQEKLRVLKVLKVLKVPGLVAAVPYRGPNAPKGPPGTTPVAMEPFMGPLKYQLMAAWLRQLALLTGLSDEQLPSSAAPFGAAAAADVTAVTSQAQLADACYSRGALCLLGLLDGGGEGAAGQVAAFEEAAEKVAAEQQPGVVSFARLDASNQAGLRAALGLRRDQLPALAVVSAKRLRAALARPGASFGAAAARELLQGVLAGKIATAPLQELPSFVEGGDEDGAAAGDAADDEAEVVEEEFDLSEIMAEDVGVHLATKEEQLKQADAELKAEAAAKAKAEAEAAATAAAAKAKAKAKASKKKAAKKKAAAAAKAADKDEL
ncbi:MAG: hypothetical protein J3K34DRAFT_526895 [Monoraphidium minutum]|nr:MAG: hypothetical protein J3K34DRAFT_526895 [Monoraphidium minutum]